MLRIHKGAAPRRLDELARTPGADWGSVRDPQKAEMRARLLEDQGGLCAYCMRRIRDGRDPRGQPTMKVEHWSARSGGADPFRWEDLLGVCLGKTGHVEHCDTARGARPLSVHPARDEVEALTRYLGDGRIVVDRRLPSGRLQAEGHRADVDALNLNAQPLKMDRKLVIEMVISRSQGADATRLRRMIEQWSGRDEAGELPENAGVALYYLRRALEDREKRARRLRKAPRP